MIETNFTKLMNRSSDLLAEITNSKSQNTNSANSASQAKVYTYRYLEVLAPENYKWEDIWVNLFLPSEIPLAAPVGTTVIIHGHPKNQHCFTPTFCHILGYKPVGKDKFWEMKWSGIYAISATKLLNTTTHSE